MILTGLSFLDNVGVFRIREGFELEADEPEHAEVPIEAAAAINDDEVGEDAGGLVTGSPPGQNPLSPLSSEEE